VKKGEKRVNFSCGAKYLLARANKKLLATIKEKG
jgi:hypothetical protein